MSESEDRAKARGWKDKDSYVDSGGDPEKWRDAETFLKVSDDHNGLLRENLKRVEDTLMRITKEREEDRKAFEEFRKFSQDANKKTEERAYQTAKREYDQQVASLKREFKEAVRNGDETAADRLTDIIEGIKKPEPPKTEDVKPQSPEEAPEFRDWKSSNDWYKKDPEMTWYADSIAQFVRASNQQLTGRAFFDRVTELVKEKYPDKFEDTKKRKSAVEGGGSDVPRGSSGKKGWDDLPEEAKQAYHDYKRIMPKFTKEEYMKTYYGE